MKPNAIQTAVALTIAGSDSSGGAGIQADLKTFSALGVYGASVITALTAQNTLGVQGIEPVRTGFVEAQLNSVLDDLDVRAIKTGMLATKETVVAIAAMLGDAQAKAAACNAPSIPLVVDPVMIASSGDALLDADAVAALATQLLPLATLLTPNLPEAAKLLGCAVATSDEDAEEQARALMDFGPAAVLLKGGHFAEAIASDDSSQEATGTPVARDRVTGHPMASDRVTSHRVTSHRVAVDLLFDGDVMTRLELPWVETHNTHGTGCTLAAAITGLLAQGVGLYDAVHRAKTYVSIALERGKDLRVGHGTGPVDHLFPLRETLKSL